MAFPTTYNGWIAYVRDWINADEYSDAQVGHFLDLAHVKMNTDLMSYPMEKLASLNTHGTPSHPPIDLIATIPDFGKIRLVSIEGVGPLDVAALNEYVTKAQDLNNTCYTPKIYNIDHQMLYIWPWPADGVAMDIYYYEKVPALGTSMNTNTFSIHHPDILLSAAVLEAAPYMAETENISVWQTKYETGVLIANMALTKIKMGSTPLVRKVS